MGGSAQLVEIQVRDALAVTHCTAWQPTASKSRSEAPSKGELQHHLLGLHDISLHVACIVGVTLTCCAFSFFWRLESVQVS